MNTSKKLERDHIKLVTPTPLDENNVTPLAQEAIEPMSNSQTRSAPTPRPVSTKPKHLASVVGDPAVPESVWMAACVLAGQKSLHKRTTLLTELWLGLLNFIGVSFVVLSSMLAYASALFTAGNLAYFSSGCTLETFITSLQGGDPLGLFLMMSVAIAFWTFLLVEVRFIKALILVPSMLFLVLMSLGLKDQGTLAAPVMALTSMLTLSLSAWFATKLKSALPKSLSGGKLARCSILWLSAPAMLMAFLLEQITTTSHHHTSYGEPTTAIFVCYLLFFGFPSLAAGYAIARASRSKSISGCASFSMLLQAALPIGLLAASLVAIIASTASLVNVGSWQFLLSGEVIDPVWQTTGVTKALWLAVVSIVSALVATSGGMLGAMRNRRS